MTWIILTVILIFFVLIKFSQNDSETSRNKKPKILVDYSFGNVTIKNSKILLEKDAFEEAKEVFSSIDPNLLTQAIDHISLNGSEETLLKWQNFAPEDELPKLFLGAFYLHQAWISRGYQRGNELNQSQVLGFVEYLDKAESHLLTIQLNPVLNIEAKSRLIRIYMGQSEYQKAKDSFEYCFNHNPEHIWSYLHLTEFIQPKWGGSTELIKSYLDRFSPETLQYKIIILKLILDSFTWNNNVFGGSMIELNDFAFETASKIHEEIEMKHPESIHKYILFNYLSTVFHELNYKNLSQKYTKLRGNYLTLYPYGITMN